MAKNVSLWGADYTAVPALDVPQTGGGTARFIDPSPTTAIDSDVASGKIYFKADGTQSTGTGSGGGGSVTQDANGFIVLPPTGGGGGGGGSSTTISGTFTTGSTEGVAETINIPYTGNSFPMSVSVWVSEGIYNTSGTVYNTLHQYAILGTTILKNNTNAPTYGNVNNDGQGAVFCVYKNSSSVATTTSTSTSWSQGIVNRNAWASIGGTIQINSSSSLSVFISSTSYGLLAGTEYRYSIEYYS